MVWSQIERRKIVERNPDIHNAEISKRLGREWKMLLPVNFYFDTSIKMFDFLVDCNCIGKALIWNLNFPYFQQEERTPYIQEAERLRELHIREFPGYKYRPKKRSKSGSDSACSSPGPSPAKSPRKLASHSDVTTPRKKAMRSKSLLLGCQSPGVSNFETPKKQQVISNHLNAFSRTSSTSSPGSPPLNRIHIVTSTIKTPPESFKVHFKIDKQFKDSVHKQVGDSAIAHLTPPLAKVPESPSSPDSPESASMYEEDSVSSSSNGGHHHTSKAPRPTADTSRRSLQAGKQIFI